MKRALSLFLTAIMILSTFSCLSVTTWAADSDVVLGEEYTVSSGTTLTFIPEESGTYLFESFGYGDPCITIYCNGGMFEFDDNNDFDFHGIIDAEEGEEINCYFYNYEEEDIVFKITKMEKPEITFIPAKSFTFIEELGGEWGEYESGDFEGDDYFSDSYYVYNPEKLFYTDNNKFLLTYKDGSSDTLVCKNGEYINSSGEVVDCYYRYDTSYEGRWLSGIDNYLTVYVLGMSTEVKVNVIENPYKSIEFIPVNPIKVIENTNGYMGGGEYWDDDHEDLL